MDESTFAFECLYEVKGRKKKMQVTLIYLKALTHLAYQTIHLACLVTI
jgi:hypothetical protein